MQNLFPTSQRVEVQNYPYGFTLRCTMFHTIEFSPKHGFRHVTQTTNPKQGNKLNAPKKSTYCPCMLLCKNAETGYTETKVLSFYGDEGINKDCAFMAANFELFTPEQIKYIYKFIHDTLVVSFKASCIYGGAKKEDVLPYFMPFIQIAAKGYNTGENVFSEIVLDVAGIKATKDPNFNPFTTTIHSY